MALKSTREAAMLAIQELAREDEKIVIVSPDAVAAARATKFREEFPDRVIEVGIAEQDAVDIAAGLATTGMKPIVVSYAGFLTMRACEMIRTFIAYPGLNVKLIGLNGGMLGGEREGVTHQFYEDVGILRSMPGVKILTPADGQQAYFAAKAMMEVDGPCYLRLGSGRASPLARSARSSPTAMMSPSLHPASSWTAPSPRLISCMRRASTERSWMSPPSSPWMTRVSRLFWPAAAAPSRSRTTTSTAVSATPSPRLPAV